MIDVNMTAGNDNALIWLVQIDLSTETLRYATRTIELDNTWSGGKIGFQSLNNLAQSADITSGGGVVELSTLNFNTKKHQSIFITNVFPTTSMPILTGRRVQLGYVWDNATADTDITWIFEGYVANFSCDAVTLMLDIFEYSDIENEYNKLPYYKVQKTFDNGISYFPNIDNAVVGVEIPIVYGKFTVDMSRSLSTNLGNAPGVLVDSEVVKYKFASHQVFAYYDVDDSVTEDDVYMFDTGVNAAVRMRPNNGLSTNNLTGTSKQMFVSAKALGDFVTGNMILLFDSPGKASEYPDIQAIYDETGGNYFTLPDNKQISVKANKNFSNSYKLGTGSTDVQFQVNWSADDDFTQIALSYYNPSSNSYSTPYVDPQPTAGSFITNLNAGLGLFTSQEILSYEWAIKNTSGSSLNIKIIQVALELNNIIIYSFPKRTQEVKVVIQNYKIPDYTIPTITITSVRI